MPNALSLPLSNIYIYLQYINMHARAIATHLGCILYKVRTYFQRLGAGKFRGAGRLNLQEKEMTPRLWHNAVLMCACMYYTHMYDCIARICVWLPGAYMSVLWLEDQCCCSCASGRSHVCCASPSFHTFNINWHETRHSDCLSSIHLSTVI